MLKRFGDFSLAVLIAIPAAVIVGLAALAVRLESAGWPLFFQQRVGREQRIFRLIKLRTMQSGTVVGASHEVGTSTVTKVGSFLRKTKIDELPQIWSVICGDMSFVGPRPCLPIQKELIAERSQRGVYSLRPGITGLAQVNGVDMSDPKRLAELDAQYLATRTIAGDLAILVATGTGKGYHDAASGELRSVGEGSSER